MMHFDEAYFFRLLTRKQSGDPLSHEEEVYIEKMLEEHEAARKLHSDFLELSSNDDFNSYLKNHVPQTEAARIIEIKKRHSRTRRRQVLFSAAACILVLVTVAAYFRFRRTPSFNDKNTVVLTLSDGRKIALPGNGAGSTTIKARKAVLHADSTALSFINTSDDQNTGVNTLTVPDGKMYRLVLSDSTIVYLNAASTIQFPFTFPGNGREIRVAGEGFIRVKPDPAKPFVVHTSFATIEVLGTDFNLNAYDSMNLRVALTKGSVRVKTLFDGRVIKPGEEAIASKAGGIGVQDFDEKETLGWMTGEYQFYRAPLSDVMNVIKRQYGVQVVYEDTLAAQIKIVCGFNKNNSLPALIRSLDIIQEIDLTLEGDTIHVRSNNKYLNSSSH